MSAVPYIYIPGVQVARLEGRIVCTAWDGYFCTFSYDAERDCWRLHGPYALPEPPKPFRNAHFTLRRRLHEALNPDRFARLHAAITANEEPPA